jgi:hypothetical protein
LAASKLSYKALVLKPAVSVIRVCHWRGWSPERILVHLFAMKSLNDTSYQQYYQTSMIEFWVVTPCGLVGRYSVSEEYTSQSHPWRWGSMFLRNVGIYLQVHTALQPIRPTSTSSPHWRPWISILWDVWLEYPSVHVSGFLICILPCTNFSTRSAMLQTPFHFVIKNPMRLLTFGRGISLDIFRPRLKDGIPRWKLCGRLPQFEL